MFERSLTRNIALYPWYKIFNKRVFLPLVAIYLVQVGHVTIPELGLIAAIGALTSLLAQIPSGYLADKTTRRSTLLIGATALAAGTLVLAVWPSFWGGLIASVLTTGGFAFISGAGEALMHDTLVTLDRSDEYVKILGRAQSKGLIGNMVLVGLVPMTYGIDKHMPFYLGFLAVVILWWVFWLMEEPPWERHEVAGNNYLHKLYVALRMFVKRKTLLLWVGIGLISAVYSASGDFNNLIFEDLGMPPEWLGWVYAGTSLVGAVGGYFLHRLRGLSFGQFIALDIAVCSGFFLAVGLSRDLWVTVAVFLINLGFWRLRGILYQAHLLKVFDGTHQKATMLSTMSFFEQAIRIWMPFVFVVATTSLGFYVGYVWMGVAVAVVIGVLFAVALRQLARFRPA
jgi:MFS family permease